MTDAQNFSEPPPSYQAAMAYPGASLPYPPNPNSASFPKPPYGAVPPCYSPVSPVTTQQFPTPPPLGIINVTAAPASDSMRAPLGNCAYCRVGVVSGQTDLCCLICLIILAICTFPVGLIFLCFVPCTVHKRCSHCHRIG
ncbi:unnamed protein product [Gongylonema pulchrum]|uniref:Membrane protein BRI3 n=1 Tax=Gongylonema pulchrum TaxID=637853 RepID=A0A183E2D9_9BILA|nr:unnamed protein product [Gongylonema pulchrum]